MLVVSVFFLLALRLGLISKEGAVAISRAADVEFKAINWNGDKKKRDACKNRDLSRKTKSEKEKAITRDQLIDLHFKLTSSRR